MKILVVTQHFWPEDFRINDLATSLRKRGHEVTVLTGFPNYPNGRVFPGYSIKLFQREVYDGVSIIRVPIYPDNSYSLIKRGWTYLSFLLSNRGDSGHYFQIYQARTGFLVGPGHLARHT